MTEEHGMNTDNFDKGMNERQEINISDRSRLTLTGVENVESFDDTAIILKSNFGMIAIDGEDLHISALSSQSGELYVEGKIGGVVFFDPRPEKGARRGQKNGSSSGKSKKSSGFFG